MKGFVAIPFDVIPDTKKGDKRFMWYKGKIIEVEVESTYDRPNGKGICVHYALKTCCGTMWVNINKLFVIKEECLEQHIEEVEQKHKKEMDKITSNRDKVTKK